MEGRVGRETKVPLGSMWLGSGGRRHACVSTVTQYEIFTPSAPRHRVYFCWGQVKSPCSLVSVKLSLWKTLSAWKGSKDWGDGTLCDRVWRGTSNCGRDHQRGQEVPVSWTWAAGQSSTVHVWVGGWLRCWAKISWSVMKQESTTLGLWLLRPTDAESNAASAQMSQENEICYRKE